MGQLVSSNCNNLSNDELIDTLMDNNYLRSDHLQKVLRSVDRKLYFTNEYKLLAYRDSAWQYNQIHLSAPSIYASVLEYLDIQQGHTFLNIGSGIGYFSTVAGLLLGEL